LSAPLTPVTSQSSTQDAHSVSTFGTEWGSHLSVRGWPCRQPLTLEKQGEEAGVTERTPPTAPALQSFLMTAGKKFRPLRAEGKVLSDVQSTSFSVARSQTGLLSAVSFQGNILQLRIYTHLGANWYNPRS